MNSFLRANTRFVKFFLISALLAAPFLTQAATTSGRATFFGPIVPLACHCDTNQTVQGTGQATISAPDYGCVLQTLQNLINFGISLGVLAVILYIAFAGFQLITNGGNPGKLAKTRERLLNAVIGIAVILSAWLIVDFVMKTLYNDSSYGPWNAILADNGNHQCLVVKNPTVISVQTVVNDATSVAPGTTGNTTSSGTASNTGIFACNAARLQSEAAASGVSISDDEANKLACLAKPESTCGQGTTGAHTASGKATSAAGPWQNILGDKDSCHSLNLPACGNLNCSAAYSGGKVKPDANSQALAAQCQKAIAGLGCSVAAADCLIKADRGYSAWTGTGDGYSHAAQKACVGN